MRVLFLRSTIVVLAALAAVGSGCSSDTGNDSEGEGTVVQSAKSRDMSPDVSSADAAVLAAGNTAFAFDLFKGLGDGSDNLFFSPYSISTALAMTYAGAANDTKTQIAKALHFDLPDARLHAAFDALDLALTKSATGRETFELVLADSLWGQAGLPFEKPFLDTLAVDYGAGMRVVDFEKDPDDSSAEINHWVAERTSNDIPELIPAGAIDDTTRFVLANAIYFNAKWATPFDPNATSPAPFTTLDGDVNVETMGVVGEFRFGKGEGYQALELPYAGRKAAMLIVMPDAGQFASVEAALDGALVDKAVASLRSDRLDVAMPKFTIDGATVSLKDELAKLGVVDAFEPSADFSGILPASAEHLHLQNVLHRAFVKVAEEGTEAAAATGVLGVGGGAIEQPPKFLAIDRPFFFFIRDIPTNTVLFVGRITDPS